MCICMNTFIKFKSVRNESGMIRVLDINCISEWVFGLSLVGKVEGFLNSILLSIHIYGISNKLIIDLMLNFCVIS